MAIDGVKIIDSDSAYDIYNSVTQRYKDGEDVEAIRQDWLREAENFCIDELYEEIYWTAFAYSLWKVGYKEDEVRKKALELIEGGACELWKEIDEKALKQRQKALDKLALHLQTDNPKPLRRPKIKKQKEPHFQEGDVLVVEMPQGYGLCFVSRVDRSVRKIEYHLACTRYLSDVYPTMDDFLRSEIACGSYNREFALQTDCWFNHKDLGDLLPCLTKLGRVRFQTYHLFLLSPASTLEDLYRQIVKEKEVLGPLQEVYGLIEEVVSQEEACVL
ncbi:hypothetical protein [Filifactor villosus]|uniref:Uncharacterized protein n=1 Tax=Filifactor villosus TaxID=29374 RepID=A0ABV9QIB5_9FIRM